MAQQNINIGAQANDGTGTPLRDAFDMINDNFTELYTASIGYSDVKSIAAGGTVVMTHNKGIPATSAVYVDDDGYIQQLLVKNAASNLSVTLYSSVTVTERTITVKF